jgi:radical SAM superfamily enzyme YgiQ (UPF0313 family)
MKKGAGADQAEWAIRKTKEYGIQATIGLIVGMPGENESSIKATKAWLRRARPDDVGVNAGAWILPGTALFQQAKKEGLMDESSWLSDQGAFKYLKGFTVEDLERWADELRSWSFKGKFIVLKRKLGNLLGIGRKRFEFTD